MPYRHYTHYLREQEQLISENRWSEMRAYDQMSEANYSLVRQIIQFKLLRIPSFTQEVLDTYQRLFGVYDGAKWAEILSRMLPLPPLSTIQFIDQRSEIDWNTSKAITPVLLRVLHSSDRQVNTMEYLEYILSHGGCVNLQINTSRQSIMYNYIIKSLQIRDLRHIEHHLMDHVTYLLEHGADPLLADHHGNTILDILVEQFADIDSSLTQSLLSLLSQYC